MHINKDKIPDGFFVVDLTVVVVTVVVFREKMKICTTYVFLNIWRILFKKYHVFIDISED